MKAAKETVVAIEYTLKDDQGNVIDASGDRGPMEYLHGAQNIIPGLEQQIEGLSAGEARSVTVPPHLGYGEFNEKLVQRVPISSFGGHAVQPGMRFHAETNLGMRVLLIREVLDQEVVLDGNHELAGKTLHFDIKVVSVRAAEMSELAHGHPHHAGGCCGGGGCGAEESSEGGCCGGGSCSEESEPKSEGGCGSGGCGCSH
jgi:FKBP-type peptidyl-prolyl cis-trans isomerase SlyD